MGWKLTLAARFFHGMGLRETLGNKGFGELASIKLKFIFEILANIVGNLSVSCDCLPSCERNT
jgi:hypothetical protein